MLLKHHNDVHAHFGNMCSKCVHRVTIDDKLRSDAQRRIEHERG